MGEVYRARDHRLERDVAVKLLPDELTENKDRLRRFEEESKAAGTLNHPNLLTVHDVGTKDGVPYLVSELLEGSTLRALVGGGSLLPLRKVVDYAAQIARGLAAAHDKGIVHRDLKPENLFVTLDGRAKILDFGLAKRTVPAHLNLEAPTGTLPTTPGTVLGTVGYMSPEQVQGLPADLRSDVFSFGAVLYEMLTGRRAFRRATRAETEAAIIRDDPPELSDLARPVPPGLERITRRCLEKSPAERFRSAHDLAFALEAITGLSVALAPERGAPRAGRLGHRLAMALAGLAVIVLPLVAYLAGLRRGEVPIPNYQRLTFRRGTVTHARFAPDGKTIIYAAAWDGDPLRLFSVRTEGPESSALDLPDADLLAISRKGEMAVALGRRSDTPGASVGSLLARAPLAGGAPREMLEDVEAADWSPDGSELAVVRNLGGRRRLEFPIGRVVYEGDNVFSPRFSPAGDLVAFTDTDKGIVGAVDRAGKVRTLALDEEAGWCLAWSARGDEVLYGASELHATTLAGRQRLLARFPAPTYGKIEDVFPDGRFLMTLSEPRTGVLGLPPDGTQEQELSWLGSSYASGLSPDGRTLLLNGPNGAYLRRTDKTTPAVRLGEGGALALSPDSKWTLLWRSASELSLTPTGAGEGRVLKSEGLEYYEAIGGGAWTPDGKAFLIVARERGRPWRVYVQDVAGGRARPVTPEGIAPHWPQVLGGTISPDGRRVAVLDGDRRIGLYSVEGGEAQTAPGPLEPGALKRWSADGKALFVTEAGDGRMIRVFRRDLATGRRVPWKDIAPADPAGLFRLDAILTPDGRSYVYTHYRFLSNLYLVEGLR